MGGKLGKPPYMGGQFRQPHFMGGKPGKPPYMGGPSIFSISPQLRYGPTGVPMLYDYHEYPQANQQPTFLAMLDLP
jgi:hypothetical protein